MTVDVYTGCFLGLALGDAYGAPFEGGLLARLIWKMIGKTPEGLPRYTDDTQMSLDLVRSLVACGCFDPEDVARRFAQSYDWKRGYGPGTAKVLTRIRRGQPWAQAASAVHPKGSFGNGAAMRAAVLALFFPEDEAELLAATERASILTHGHPLAIEGAQLISAATRLLLHHTPVPDVMERLTHLRRSPEYAERLEWASRWLLRQELVPAKEVVKRLGHGITAPTSVVTAVYIALRHLRSPFADLLAFTRQCGGDVDTVGAMAGALWGAARGASQLPDLPVEGQEEIRSLAEQLYQRQV